MSSSPVLQKIGAVAQRSGVPVKTIRFYCDQGLLQPSARSEGRYRLFDETVYDELALIRMLRALEIPLVTIGEVLKARRSGICHCNELKGTIGSKAGEIQRRIRDLQHLHGELTGMLDTWQACGGRRQSEPGRGEQPPGGRGELDGPVVRTRSHRTSPPAPHRPASVHSPCG